MQQNKQNSKPNIHSKLFFAAQEPTLEATFPKNRKARQAPSAASLNYTLKNWDTQAPENKKPLQLKRRKGLNLLAPRARLELATG